MSSIEDMQGLALRILFGNPLYDASLGDKLPVTVASIGGSLLSVHASQLADNLAAFPSELGAVTSLAGDLQFRALPLMLADAARLTARSMLSANNRWSETAWRADILGERTARLIAAHQTLVTGADALDARLFGRTILRGARHLHRAPIIVPKPWRRFHAHRGRIFSALALRELRGRLERDLRALGADADSQVLGDGGHVERSPAKALAVLAMLIEIRDVLALRQIEPPAGLISAIDRMAPFIRALRMGDGGLTLLGGGRSGHEDLIDAVLDASGSHGRAMAFAPHSGYCRLRSGQTTVLVDTGTPEHAVAEAHLSPLAFELSIGKMRVVTGCGMARADLAGADAWAPALRGTAGHSALIVAEANARAMTVHAERREHEGARLIEGWHDGYETSFGIRHHRSLYLDAGGGDLRGEDRLTGDLPVPYAIRFHLHPDVAAVPVEGGREAILRLPRGPGWRFRSGHPIVVEDSVHFGDGTRRRAQQIVVHGLHDGETVVKWRLAIER